ERAISRAADRSGGRNAEVEQPPGGGLANRRAGERNPAPGLIRTGGDDVGDGAPFGGPRIGGDRGERLRARPVRGRDRPAHTSSGPQRGTKSCSRQNPRG